MCTESVPNGMNVNMQLEQGLLGGTAPRMLDDDEDWEENNDPRASLLRFNVGSDEVKGEKPTDKWGYGIGKGFYTNKLHLYSSNQLVYQLDFSKKI